MRRKQRESFQLFPRHRNIPKKQLQKEKFNENEKLLLSFGQENPSIRKYLKVDVRKMTKSEWINC